MRNKLIKMKNIRLAGILLSLALVLGLLPGMSLTALAETALPANGSDAGGGLSYYVGGFINATGSGYVDDRGAATKLFDGIGNDANNKLCWRIDNNTANIEFEISEPFVPQKYYLRTGGDTAQYPERNPKDWKIYGRLTTSDEWTVIATVSNDTTMGAVNYESYEFNFTNSDNMVCSIRALYSSSCPRFCK